jgi:LAS superfamily LD-carboxypeptidase LdcB
MLHIIILIYNLKKKVMKKLILSIAILASVSLFSVNAQDDQKNQATEAQTEQTKEAEAPEVKTEEAEVKEAPEAQPEQKAEAASDTTQEAPAAESVAQ